MRVGRKDGMALLGFRIFVSVKRRRVLARARTTARSALYADIKIRHGKCNMVLNTQRHTCIYLHALLFLYMSIYFFV